MEFCTTTKLFQEDKESGSYPVGYELGFVREPLGVELVFGEMDGSEVSPHLKWKEVGLAGETRSCSWESKHSE